MTLHILEFITQAVSSWGYLGIFLTMTLESMLIPIPSEAVMPFAGFLAHAGTMNIWVAVLVASLANLIGSIVAYFIGKYLGRGFVTRYGRYVLLNIHHLELVESWFKKYGNVTVLFSRMLPVVRSINALPAGIGKMNIPQFCLFTFLGSVPWNLALVYAGYLLKENWNLLEKYALYIDIVVVTAIIIMIIYLVKKIVDSARASKNSTDY